MKLYENKKNKTFGKMSHADCQKGI